MLFLESIGTSIKMALFCEVSFFFELLLFAFSFLSIKAFSVLFHYGIWKILYNKCFLYQSLFFKN
ncbi:MAG: hypothetical protein C0193_00090 [Candidatus Bathyarchaeota archaeon]|nr:MAG: hypothetical protein C0193_00090 [Candidatus Bathyarchaeota archaeon]